MRAFYLFVVACALERTWFRTDHRVTAGRHHEVVEVQQAPHPLPDEAAAMHPNLMTSQSMDFPVASSPGQPPAPRGRGGQ